MNESEAPDPIDEAIEATEPDDVLNVNATLTNGKTIAMQVPNPFGTDEFESAVAMLIAARAESDRRKEAKANSGLAVPVKPMLIDPAGRRLT